ncbi:MAG: hypothetical protein ACI9FG_001629 [Crocinitomicaceae bacterium]|jgi:hypothetical protein
MLFGMSVAMTGIVHPSVWVMKEPITKNNRASEVTKTLNSGKNIHTASFSYAFEHNGLLPGDLNILLKRDDGNENWQELSPADLYYQPKNKELPPEPWVYYPWTTTSRPRLIMLHSSSPAFGGKWLVVQVSGSVKIISDGEFQEMFALTQKILRKKRAQLKPGSSGSEL